MFDNDLLTYWFGYKPITLQNSVTVTFKEKVKFYGLHIITRPAHLELFHGSYQNMCLVLNKNKNKKICTNADYNVQAGHLIMLATAQIISVKKIKLVIQEGEVGQIADLKIYYKGNVAYKIVVT